MSAVQFVIANRPAFKIFFPDTGKWITIWPDGKVEGIEEPYAIINQIPLHMLHHELLKESVKN